MRLHSRHSAAAPEPEVDDHREARPEQRASAVSFRRSPGQPPTPCVAVRQCLRGGLL